MSLMTGEQYIESIRKIPMEIYMFGEKVENPVDDPILRPSLNSVRMTYDLAQMPEYQELMTAVSPETGERINRFTHIHRSTEDLRNKVKMQRLLGQKTASCFQRCVGMDAFNAEYSTTFEIDQKYGTHYHENFKKFMLYCQQNDLTVDGAMTDTKGDRFKAPTPRPTRTCSCGWWSAGRTAWWCAAPRPTRPASSTATRSSSCPPSPWGRTTRTTPSPSPCRWTPRGCS